MTCGRIATVPLGQSSSGGASVAAKEKTFSEALAEAIVATTVQPKAKRVRKPKVEVFPVETVKVNDSVWNTALALAGNDKSKIKILAHNKVLVG